MNDTQANVKIKDSIEVCEQVGDNLWLARMNNFNTRLTFAECKPTCFKSSANQQNKKLIKQHKHKGSLKYIIQVLRLQLVNHDYNQTGSFQTAK